MDLDKYECRSIVFKLQKKIPAYSLLAFAENIAWQLWFVVQFCFLCNSSLKIKSSISLLDSTTKNSDWSSALRQSHLRTLKTIGLFKFQFVNYGSWQIWKPLNRVQPSKIKKFQRTLYCFWLKTLRDNYDLLYIFVSYSTLPWKLSFVVQFSFSFNFSLNLKRSISLWQYNYELWMIKCSQSVIWGLVWRTGLFEFQYVCYGCWQIWKKLKRAQTLPLAEIRHWKLARFVIVFSDFFEWPVNSQRVLLINLWQLKMI